MCVLSAVIATLVILAACIVELVFYHFKPEWLNLWTNNDSLANNGGDADVHTNKNDTNLLLNDTLFINDIVANNSLITNLTNILINNVTATEGSIIDGIIEGIDGGSGNNVNEESNENIGLSINGTVFVILASTIGILAAISAGLLIHLCFFHIYISYLGLTTYEYIRQQKSAQVTFPSNFTQKNGTGVENRQNGPSTSISKVSKEPRTKNKFSFFRSKSVGADFYFCSTTNNNPSPVESPPVRPKTLYCCDRVEQQSYHHRKAYYMCSMLEETNNFTDSDTTSHSAQNNVSTVNYYPGTEKYGTKTFHCCSEFVDANIADTTDSNDAYYSGGDAVIGQSRHEAFVHYTEQCTFCSFRIKTPAKSKHISVEDKRCCLKSMSKHHRWKRKWNCCSSVPDSPDVPMGDPVRTISATVPQLPTVLNVQQNSHNEQQPTALQSNNANNITIERTTTATTMRTGVDNSFDENSANNNTINNQQNTNTENSNGLSNRNINSNHTVNNNHNHNNNGNTIEAEINMNTISNSMSNSSIDISSSSSSSTTVMPPSSSSTASTPVTCTKRVRARSIRPWPVVRLRHMFRLIGTKYRRPRCRHSGVTAVQIKQNQIRPLPEDTENANVPETNGTSSYHAEENLIHNGQYTTAVQHQTILPTSAIRSETIHHHHQYTLPALPPPQRRKIKSPEEIQDLADTLSFVHQQQSQQNQQGSSTIIRLSAPSINNSHRRLRRKQILRPRSPTLSPIHESGLSNPTSPLPYRHSYSKSLTALNNSHLCLNIPVSPQHKV